MYRRYLSFRARHQPYMVRHTYVHEMRSALTYPLAAALAEGSFTGIVAAKYFHASPTLIAVITAAPMFGNIAALLWAEMGKSRRKVPFVNLLQVGVITCVAAVALTYWMPQQVGAWVFAGLIIAARVAASGIVTLRSAIWRFNYPRHLRGQIISRITVIATAVLALTTLLGSLWLDRRPTAYVYLYPLAGVIGLVGIWQFAQIRVRREGQMLRRTRQPLYTPRPENLAQTDEANVLNFQPPPSQGLAALLRDSLEVMRTDKTFRDYQRWQFLSGAAFMIMTPPLVFMISKDLTDPVKEYALATMVLQIVPMLTIIVFTQLWAPLFDRLHITRFRMMQGFVSVAALSTIWLGANMSHLGVVAFGQFLSGVANAGGNLAWNLGHNDFAPPEKTATYMGVHVMLTGLRGMMAPFVGVWLYQIPWIGREVFAVSAALSLVSLIGFTYMARHAPRKLSTGATAQRRQTTVSK